MNTLIIIAAKYLIVVPLVIAVWLFLKEPKTTWRKNALHALGVLIGAFIIAKASSHFYLDPRPFAVEHFEPLIPHAADNGFPSDHTLLASALAAIVMCYRKHLGYVLWIIAAVIGIARVYAGVHHLVDIAGSMLIALIAALLIHIVEKHFKNGIITA